MSSLAECMNLGHQHPRVVSAIQEQAGHLCFASSAWGARPRAELAKLLLEKAGFDGGRVFFSLGGADANEHAVKFARLAGGKPDGWIVTRHHSYHGASYAAMALSGDSRTSHQVRAADFGVVRVPPPYAYRCPFGSGSPGECAQRAVAHLGQTIQQHDPASVAAVLREPNAGTNGIVAPDEFWPVLREARLHPSMRLFVERARESGVSFAVRGNLIILAHPLVIDDADLDDALSLMKRFLTELKWQRPTS
jgi:taurine--2-oxoglutarate transaminase